MDKVLTEDNSIALLCPECLNSFRIKGVNYRKRLKRNPQATIYCSTACRHLGESKRMIERNRAISIKEGKRRDVVCDICNKSFSKQTRKIKELNFCSLKCSNIYNSIRIKSIPLEDPYTKWIKNVQVPQDIVKDCWIWTGAVQPWKPNNPALGLYGSFIWPGEMAAPAHVASYRLFHGDNNTKGYHICHTCDVRICVNPFHLFKGTAKDNQQDCLAKGRKPEGVSHPRAKFSIEDVLLIRKLYRDRVCSLGQLARFYEVSSIAVKRLVTYKTYKNIS